MRTSESNGDGFCWLCEEQHPLPAGASDLECLWPQFQAAVKAARDAIIMDLEERLT